MFELKDEVSEAEKIYIELQELDIEETISYSKLTEILGRPFLKSRAPFYQARKWLEQRDKRTLDCIPDVGYRVVRPNEHERLARHHYKKGQRQLKRSISKASSADRSALTQEEREKIDQIEQRLRGHADMLTRLDGRQKRLEEAVEKTQQESKAKDAAVEERLLQLEQAISRMQG